AYTMTQIQRQGHTVTAIFDFPIIQATSGDNGSIEPEGSIQLKAGENQTFSIQPNSGFEIQDILIDGISVGPQNEITLSNIQKHYSIKAIFKERERFDFQIVFDSSTLNVQSGQSFAVTLTSDQSPYTLSVFKGDTVSINIQTDTTQFIKEILLDGSALSNNDTIIIPDIQQAHDFKITFLPIIVETNVQGSGTISPSGTIPLVNGQNQTFEILPEPGYFIQSLIVDGQPVTIQNTYTFWDIRTAHTIDATFHAHDPLSLTITVDEGGSITISDYRRDPIKSASGPDTYTVQSLPESRLILTIAPGEGYRLSDVVINGKSNGVKTEIILDNIQSAFDISSIF
ncbi:hypothetical protein MHK_008536, partial [Candidatus Magnetomorum sp. HK-1]